MRPAEKKYYKGNLGKVTEIFVEFGPEDISINMKFNVGSDISGIVLKCLRLESNASDRKRQILVKSIWVISTIRDRDPSTYQLEEYPNDDEKHGILLQLKPREEKESESQKWILIQRDDIFPADEFFNTLFVIDRVSIP